MPSSKSGRRRIGWIGSHLAEVLRGEKDTTRLASAVAKDILKQMLKKFLSSCLNQKTVFALQIAGLCLALLAITPSALAIEVTMQPDKTYSVKAKTYEAKFDALGNWRSLLVDGVEFLGEKPLAGVPFPGENQIVNLQNLMLSVRSDKARVEYSFDENGISIESDGQILSGSFSPAITAYIKADGQTFAATVKSSAEISKVVAGKAAIQLTQPVHLFQGKFHPSAFPSGRAKPADVFHQRIECGISPNPEELIEIKEVRRLGGDPKYGVTWFSKEETPKFALDFKNLGSQPANPEVKVTVVDHFVDGKVLNTISLPPSAVDPGGEKSLEFEVPTSGPGIYWLQIEIKKDGKAIKRTRSAFVYDGDNYLPPLTRPPDFEDFWKKKISEARSVPLDPKLTEVPEKSSPEATYYNLELTTWKGKRVNAQLMVPKKPGKHHAFFGGSPPAKATNADQVQLALQRSEWPDEAQFRRWKSADENNLLECYLIALRLTDYLRSREDVDQIYLYGASRTGPIQLANAALDTERISAVNAHVPTSLGVSWPDYFYAGWGNFGGVPPPKEKANYVDPVNFAQDLTVPFIMDVGVYDGLSPAPGAIAFFNYAKKSPWKRLSIEPGGHGYFTSTFRKVENAALQEILKTNTSNSNDDKILREH